jgi:cob(I)alamin adenosyltransferase
VSAGGPPAEQGDPLKTHLAFFGYFVYMVSMPIYTKTGDKGETSLFGGTRVKKSHIQVEAYGAIDELNSWVGKIVATFPHEPLKSFFVQIQSDLFTIGGTLAGWKGDLGPIESRITEMEVHIDALESKLPELTSFILPGGNDLSSTVHIARSVCRRAERDIVALSEKNDIDPIILQYINRLSDLFFVTARFINGDAGVLEKLWSGIRQKNK